jgi:anti-sigma factor (TIGR02949 family)
MDKHNCGMLLGELSEYVDGELAAELCAALERHLADCPKCTVVVNTLRKTIDLYHEASECEALPEDVRKRLFARLDLEGYLSHE